MQATERAESETTRSYEIAVFEGDGIGPEIRAPTLSLLTGLAGSSRTYDLRFTTLPAGTAHYARTGVSLPEASLRAAGEADAILLSATGPRRTSQAKGLPTRTRCSYLPP
mgnify:CR=1 FL=1